MDLLAACGAVRLAARGDIGSGKSMVSMSHVPRAWASVLTDLGTALNLMALASTGGGLWRVTRQHALPAAAVAHGEEAMLPSRQGGRIWAQGCLIGRRRPQVTTAVSAQAARGATCGVVTKAPTTPDGH